MKGLRAFFVLGPYRAEQRRREKKRSLSGRASPLLSRRALPIIKGQRVRDPG